MAIKLDPTNGKNRQPANSQNNDRWSNLSYQNPRSDFATGLIEELAAILEVDAACLRSSDIKASRDFPIKFEDATLPEQLRSLRKPQRKDQVDPQENLEVPKLKLVYSSS